LNYDNRRKYERYLLQNLGEWEDFMKLARNEGVRSYLEVGCKHGGSFWRMSTNLPKGSRVVAVDLPHGDHSFKNTLPNLTECVDRLKGKGYDAHMIIGDSTSEEVIEKVRALGPFDLAFIDGNHTYPFVKKDWENYGPMSKRIAFHDISFYREGGQHPDKMPIDAPRFWKEIKDDYRNVEFRREKTDNGIGVIWMS